MAKPPRVRATPSKHTVWSTTSLGVQAPGRPKLRQGDAYILLRVREHSSRGWNNKLKPEQGVGVCTRSGCTLVCEHAPYSRGWNNKHQAAQQTRPRPQPEAGAQHPDTRLRFRSTREQPAHGCLRTGVPKGRGSQRTAAQNTRRSFGVRGSPALRKAGGLPAHIGAQHQEDAQQPPLHTRKRM